MADVQAMIHDGPLLEPPREFVCTGAGATVCFEGRVRPEENGRTIRGLYYEVYEPMAQNTLLAIADEIGCRYGLLGLRVEHSRGLVQVGQCSFRLQVVSRHRQEALAAMSEFIDRMKQDAPIWKTAVESLESRL